MSRITTLPIKGLYRLDSIRTLYKLEKVHHETFTIPDYQRGYRWEANLHVKALLTDILDFMNMKRNVDDRYCLQPIVVTQSLTQKNAWELIDGQQRLITIYLLLHALDLPSFDLIFETRPKSNDFLIQLITNDTTNHDDPDFHFMSEAWIQIKQWLKENEEQNPGFELEYKPTLWKNVNVIWYDIESESRNINIDVFNRLNIGKIPLNDAELVKALLLSKIKGRYKDPIELTMRQSEINTEWQHIEIELRKPQKWGFITGNTNKEYDSHIEFLFDLMAQNKVNIDTHQKYTTYLWFERQITSIDPSPEIQADMAISLWEQVKQAYARINSWFCDDNIESNTSIYHYVGYLLASRKAQVHDLYNYSVGKSRKEFCNHLKKMIKKILNEIDIENLNYEENNDTIRILLLLFNVLTCEKIADGMYNRFPFDRYNKTAKENRNRGGWSLEHIFAQNSQDPMKDPKAAIRWLNDTYKSIKNIDCVTKMEKKENQNELEKKEINLKELKIQIEKMQQIPSNKLDMHAFNKLKNNINDIFGEPDKHPLSNLALLSKNDNSALNNAIFPTKRNRIIELEKAGHFIPPCTRNVFLKFYSPSDSQPYYWSKEDQDAYLSEIIKTFNEFKNN